MKKVFKTMFFVSLAILLLFAVFVAVASVASINTHSGSVGIIGGADGPTAIFITGSLIFGTPIFWVLAVAVMVLIASAIGWIATKNKK